MTRYSVWTNSDGLQVGYGPRDSLIPQAGTVRTMGNINVVTSIIDHANMPLLANTNLVASSKVITRNVPIPAYAVITRASFYCVETFADADANPSMTIGLVAADGSTAIDADGIFKGLTEASGKLTAGATTVGSWYDAGVADGAATTYAGALIGASIGSAAGYIYAVLSTGAWDAGKGILTVEYLLQMPDDEPTSPHSTTTKLS